MTAFWWIVIILVVTLLVCLTIIDWALCKIAGDADNLAERIRAHDREGM